MLGAVISFKGGVVEAPSFAKSRPRIKRNGYRVAVFVNVRLPHHSPCRGVALVVNKALKRACYGSRLFKWWVFAYSLIRVPRSIVVIIIVFVFVIIIVWIFLTKTFGAFTSFAVPIAF